MKSLEIKKLKVSVEGKKIINGLDLTIRTGQVHALMGPNGSGKSTLSSAIMGHPGYQITGGTIVVFGKRINAWSPEKRAQQGVFLSFQYPVEIPGLSIEHFLRTAFNNLYPKKKLSPLQFRALLEEKMELLHVRRDLGDRSLNEGFSGGEKKKLEILQMAVLQPRLAILDETDSGLDIDALKNVAHGIGAIRSSTTSVLLITHYFRILRYIKPDFVHILINGRIVKSGDRKLASEVERRGYDWLH